MKNEITRKREEIERHIAKYLSGGGVITSVKHTENRGFKEKGSAKWLLNTPSVKR
jgi:hypothetical protein